VGKSGSTRTPPLQLAGLGNDATFAPPLAAKHMCTFGIPARRFLAAIAVNSSEIPKVIQVPNEE
jgi:hypothetical protein